jgi:NTE family protein
MNQRSKRRIAIACQGGGSHTAFTAGVLKKILGDIKDDGRYEIIGLSGTSGGAICAFLTWHALQTTNGEHEAIRLLEEFWRTDNSVSWPQEEWFANTLLQSTMSLVEDTTGMPPTNPYRIPELFRFIPPLRSPDYWQEQLGYALRKRVNDNVSTADNVGTAGPALYIGAVNPVTGEFQVFKSHKRNADGTLVPNQTPDDSISVEAVLASAAIPTIFKAIELGEAVYWRGSENGVSRISEGIYWDGLYSSNPPIRELAELNPDEIWVIQINPEEINRTPTGTEEMTDRRNELAGNLSLNQELYFVRRTNELVRRCGHYEDGVFKLGGGSSPDKREYRTIKLRRVELTRDLDYSSKLDRDAASIARLIDEDADREATPFLDALPLCHALEEVWEDVLQRVSKATNGEADEALDRVMEVLSEHAEIKVVPPANSSASATVLSDTDEIRECVKWALESGFTPEQTRYYRVEENTISWWMLATTPRLQYPVKVRVEIVNGDDGINRISFYPLDMQTVEAMRQSASRSR